MMLSRVSSPWLAAVAVVAASFSLVSCRDPEAATQRHLEKGDALVAAGNFQEAALEYRNAVKYSPRHGEAHYKLAETWVRTGRTLDAAREYVRAAEILTRRADVQVKAATILLAAGEFDQARKHANNALKSEPRNIEAHIILANVLAGLKDVDGALEQLQDAIQIAPEDARPYTSIGTVHARQGNREEAETAFKRAVDINPKSVAARLALAHFYWASERTEEAERTLHTALEIDDGNEQANHMLATLYLTTNRRSEAETPLLRLVNRQHPGATIRLADLYLATSRAEKARELYEGLKDNKQSRVVAIARLAAMDYAANKTEAAHAAVDEILKAQPHHTELLILKSRWYIREQRLDDALKTATQAVSGAPGSAPASYTLGLVHLARRETEEAAKAFTETLRLNPRVIGAELHLSRLMLNRGDGDRALAHAESARRLEPKNPDVRLAFAAALLAKRDLDRADGELRTLRAEYPQASAVQALHGRLLLQRGDIPGAARALDRALELNPRDWQALNNRLAVDVRTKRIADGRSRLKTALADNAKDSDLLLTAARFELTAGDSVTAEGYLRRSIEADAANLDAYSTLANLYLSQRKLDEAKAEFQKLVTRRPESVTYRTMVGMILETQQRPNEAIKVYEEIVRMSAAAPVAANNLAYHYAVRGEKLDEALQLAQRAKQQMPDRHEVNDTLGWIYYKKNLPSLAIPPLEASVAKDPNNAMYQFHLGLAYAQAGRKEEARRALEHALRLQPNFDGAHEARTTLTQLKG